MKCKHLFLALALLEFAVGMSNARPNIFFYLGLPLATIFFILYLIVQLTEAEMALDDEQHRQAALVPVNSRSSIQRPPASPSKTPAQPTLQTAPSH